MKKIVFYILSLKIGGSEKACVRMANALVEDYDVTVQTYFGNGELEKELDRRIHYHYNFPHFIRGLARLNYLPPRLAHRMFIGNGYDIEIAVGDGLESHVVSGSCNKKIFSWIHINLGENGTHQSEKTIKRFSAFNRIICVSNCNKERFLDEFNGFDDKTIVSYTPIDFHDIKRKAGVPGEKSHRFIAVGRLEKVKGFDRLIEAVHLLDDPEIQIDIYGDGTQKNVLQKMIDGYCLSNKIHLKGIVDNPYPFIQSADALICPSVDESFGFSIVEAMFLGTKVLATKCGGSEEIILLPTQGLLCKNSVEGLRDGLCKLLTSDHSIDLQQAYIRACDFNIEKCKANFCEIIGD